MASTGIGSFVIGESPIGINFQPTSVQEILPSYLYVQYNDDDDLQALVTAYNQYAQAFLDWFNNLNLPVYNSAAVTGALLDWVAQGLYGVSRPVLSFGTSHLVGPLNTARFNTLRFDQLQRIGPSGFEVVNDDVFRRILTWYFFTGDGTQFTLSWLKRRVMRFLFGLNGYDLPVDQTYRVSVTFGPTAGAQVVYREVKGPRTITGAGFFNRAQFNTIPFDFIATKQAKSRLPFVRNDKVSIRIVGGAANILRAAIPNTQRFNAIGFNQITSSFTAYPLISMAKILQAAVQSGVLPLPLQYSYEVTTS